MVRSSPSLDSDDRLRIARSCPNVRSTARRLEGVGSSRGAVLPYSPQPQVAIDLIHLYAPPVATNDRAADFGRRLPIFMKSFGKEDLLDADQSAGSVICPVAVQQPAVPELITVAVAGLLHQYLRDLSRHLIRSSHAGISE